MDVENVKNAAKHNKPIQDARDVTSRNKKTERSAEPSQKAQGDEVTISRAAKEKSKIASYVDIINKMPDVRKDEIERVKNNVEKDLYSSRDVLKDTAEKMLGE